MIILGIDPGIADLGWGIIEKSKATPAKRGVTAKGRSKDQRLKRGARKWRLKYVAHGVIKTSSGEPTANRLWEIKSVIDRLLGEYSVDEMAVERIVFNINRRTAIIVAKAHGAVLVAAGKRNIPTYEYNALTAKRLVTGDGRADKKTVQLGVKRKLRLKKHPTPVHGADALAMALCHILNDSEKC